jgi:catechol 2,3-dioxygenase
MTGVKRFEHAQLRVTDLDAAVEFYKDVLGLVEIDRSDGAVYLGCGLDENYDVGLVEGKTGVDHFAVRMDDSEELATYEQRLQSADIETERTDGAEPNQEEGVRFTLPSGADMELVTVTDSSYHHPTETHEDRDAVAPLDVDHINLMSWNVDEDKDVLTEHLDFQVSDEIVGESGFSIQAWLRSGEFHHDVGISTADNVQYTLHHLSFEADSMEHIKRLADTLADNGHDIEYGPSRHNAGANLFLYLWTPGGNRIEISAEVATVDHEAETGVREIDTSTNTVSRWGGSPPPATFLGEGS